MIATMVIGAITLAVILPAYEIFIHKRGKQPYLPIHLFKNISMHPDISSEVLAVANVFATQDSCLQQ